MRRLGRNFLRRWIESFSSCVYTECFVERGEDEENEEV